MSNNPDEWACEEAWERLHEYLKSARLTQDLATLCATLPSQYSRWAEDAVFDAVATIFAEIARRETAPDARTPQFRSKAAFLSYVQKRALWKAKDYAGAYNRELRALSKYFAATRGRTRSNTPDGTAAGEIKALMASVLSPEELSLMLLRFSGMSLAELGSHTGLKHNAIRSRLYRAKQKLREGLEQNVIRSLL